jgi:hypothetical protein
MDLDSLIGSLKSQVLGSLETHVYQQAVQQNLVDTVLRELIESAIERLQVQMPGAASVGGALLGVLGALAPTVKSLGLDQQIVGLIRQAGVDTAMRDTVIRGISRYLEENGAHLMEVAVNAVINKLTRAS